MSRKQQRVRWPPVGNLLRWLMIGAPAAVAAALIISFFVFRSAEIKDKEVTAVYPTVSKTVENKSEPLNQTEEIDTLASQPVLNPTKQSKRFAHSAKVHHAERLTAVKRTAVPKANTKEEIKTEFIALSYARDPESGQIVRVKVPSSMMVSLGLVASVQKAVRSGRC